MSWQSLVRSWLVLDWFDSARIRSVVGSRERHIVAAGLQAALLGAPMICAGTEWGLTAAVGEEGWIPMPRNRPQERDEVLYEAYRTLFQLRANQPALREGGLRSLHSDADTLVYARETLNKSMTVAARRAPGPAVRLPAERTLHAVYAADDLVPRNGAVSCPGKGHRCACGGCRRVPDAEVDYLTTVPSPDTLPATDCGRTRLSRTRVSRSGPALSQRCQRGDGRPSFPGRWRGDRRAGLRLRWAGPVVGQRAEWTGVRPASLGRQPLPLATRSTRGASMQIITRLASVLAGLALLTTACGGDGGTGSTASKRAVPNESAAASGAPTRSDADLVVWTDQPKVEAIQQIADGFAKENGISVDVQATTDTQASFVTANAAGNGPDVVVGAHDWIGNLVQNGAIEPLQLSAEQLSPYAHNAVEAVTYQEKLYGLPYGVEALVLYRNTALVPQTPATLDDAFKAGQAVVAAGKAESAFNLPVGEVGDAYHMQPLFTSAGGYVFGQTSTGDYNPKDLGLAKPEAVAAAKKIASIGEAGSKVLTRSVSADNSIALFTAGKAPFLLSGPWARPDIEKAGLKYAVQPVPGFAGGQQPKPFAGVQAFFVASKGKNRAFGQEFVSNAMNTPQAMQIMYERTKLPPTLTSLQQSAGAADPQLKAFLDAANSGEPMPAIPQMQAVFGPLSKAYSAIIGGADPTSTMQSTGKTVADAIS